MDSKIIITANEAAPDDLQQIGERYWAHRWAISQPEWSEELRDIDHIEWHSNASVAAAAGATAVLEGHHCRECGSQLVCSSRGTALRALRGEGVRCVQCTPGLAKKKGQVLDPDYHAKQLEKARRIREERAEAEAEHQKFVRRFQRDQKRQAALRQAYGSADAACDPSVLDETPLSVVLGALILAKDPELTRDRVLEEDLYDGTTSIYDVFAPPFLRTLLLDAWRHGLVTPDPQSDHRAFTWDSNESFTPAGIQDPSLLDFRIESTTVSHDGICARLLASARSPHRSQQDITQFRALIRDVIAEEATTFFITQMWARRFAAPSEDEIQHLRALAAAAARTTSLRKILTVISAAISKGCADPIDLHLSINAPTSYLLSYVTKALQNPDMIDQIVSHDSDAVSTYQPTEMAATAILLTLHLAPLSPETTPEAIDAAISQLWPSAPSSPSIAPDLLAAVQRYAADRGSDPADVIASAIEQALPPSYRPARRT